MFYAARNLSEYYVQIEDDVVCAKDFIQKMKNFISKQKKPWSTLNFSELGFIGKVKVVFTYINQFNLHYIFQVG